jgi:hypothetical protein
LGIGDWAQSPIPNPQSPIPHPHQFILAKIILIKIINNLRFEKKIYINNLLIKLNKFP